MQFMIVLWGFSLSLPIRVSRRCLTSDADVQTMDLPSLCALMGDIDVSDDEKVSDDEEEGNEQHA